MASSRRRLQTYATEAIAVTFDPKLCIHAAECIRTAPKVFDSRRLRWIQPGLGDAALIATAVHRCPTGALSYLLPNGAPETADAAEIRPAHDGPLYVRGEARIEAEDGRVIVEGFRIALCRCGATKNAPFCDGSHHAAGFTDR